MIHKPVLEKEVIECLDPKPNENFIDCTLGHGGHARLILERTSPNGKLVGIDQDPEQIKIAKEQLKEFGSRLIAVNSSYTHLKEIAKDITVNGILLDMGMSSWHLEDSKRGFSFQKDEPLDMRYDPSQAETAEDIVNHYSEEDLARIFSEYGQERFAARIARAIVRKRPLRTTGQLVELIKVPGSSKIHPATRVFQALRIAVNKELENIEIVIPQAIEVLAQGGRLAVISFHSLEDRIVKNYFKKQKLLFKKPITASREEIRENPRSRSAKLRLMIK